MSKNKNIVYLIIFSLIIVVGFILLTSGKGGNEINNSALLSKEKLSFKNAIGKQAPDFSLESIDGTTVKLSDYRGKIVVLFFNEGSMCYPACWNQIQQLADDERLNSDDVVAFSLVIDPKSTWEKIVNKTPEFSKAKILFDPTKVVSFAYDILSLPSSMHPNRNLGHTYFTTDTEGIVRYVYADPSMAIRTALINSEVFKLH